MRKVCLTLLTLFFVLSGGVATGSGASENLLENPSLGRWDEEGIANWTGQFAQHADYRIEGLLGHNASARETPYFDYAYQEVEVEEGIYFAEAWFKVPGEGTGEAWIRYTDVEGEDKDSEKLEIQSEDGWQGVEMEIDQDSAGTGTIGLGVHRGDEPEADVAAGAAWFSTEPSPEGWPKDKNGDEEEDGDEDDDQEENETNDKEERIEINSADSEDLQRITNIGPTIANRIKEDCGSFYSLAHLIQVEGLGEATVREIKQEGKAYVMPPEDGWDLSENVCTDVEETETEEEKCEVRMQDIQRAINRMDSGEMSALRNYVYPDEEEDPTEREKEFELFSHDEEVEQGGSMQSTVLIRNQDSVAKDLVVYSYLYEDQKTINEEGWTGNEERVEVEPEGKRALVLENRIGKDAKPGEYDFKVRIRDEADLEGTVDVVEGEIVEDNTTDVEITGEVYRRKGPLERIVDYIMSLF